MRRRAKRRSGGEKGARWGCSGHFRRGGRGRGSGFEGRRARKTGCWRRGRRTASTRRKSLKECASVMPGEEPFRELVTAGGGRRTKSTRPAATRSFSFWAPRNPAKIKRGRKRTMNCRWLLKRPYRGKPPQLRSVHEVTVSEQDLHEKADTRRTKICRRV